MSGFKCRRESDKYKMATLILTVTFAALTVASQWGESVSDATHLSRRVDVVEADVAANHAEFLSHDKWSQDKWAEIVGRFAADAEIDRSVDRRLGNIELKLDKVLTATVGKVPTLTGGGTDFVGTMAQDIQPSK
ncbi:MAG: hypothetical protein ACKV2Q_36635 [Planctomycetaceae bacterium]